jgi:PhnB protein
MSKTSTYLNFTRGTEEAFKFYKSVFGGEFTGIMRFKEMPPMENMPPLPEEDKNLVMHMSMIIMGGHELMGSDAPESMGFKVSQGNNVYIMLQPDTRSETDKLFKGLSQGATIEQELQDMFWGDYYGSLKDKFGVQWMFACPEKK